MTTRFATSFRLTVSITGVLCACCVARAGFGDPEQTVFFAKIFIYVDDSVAGGAARASCSETDGFDKAASAAYAEQLLEAVSTIYRRDLGVTLVDPSTGASPPGFISCCQPPAWSVTPLNCSLDAMSQYWQSIDCEYDIEGQLIPCSQIDRAAVLWLTTPDYGFFPPTLEYWGFAGTGECPPPASLGLCLDGAAFSFNSIRGALPPAGVEDHPDSFDVYLVAHELGHQFTESNQHNSTCPSTIMNVRNDCGIIGPCNMSGKELRFHPDDQATILQNLQGFDCPGFSLLTRPLGDWDLDGSVTEADLTGAEDCLCRESPAAGCIEAFDENGDGTFSECEYKSLAQFINATAPDPIPDCDGDGFPECCCGDENGDGIRDDACLWYECVVGAVPCQTQHRDAGQADMGGAFGACPIDGSCDGHDRFHALNCFSNQDTQGNPPYPCEESPPSALNVDAGGPGSSCVLDGVCDNNDAFHALRCFTNNPPYLCTCSPSPDPPENPMETPAPVALTLAPGEQLAQQGDVVEIEVFINNPVQCLLLGYQLHTGVTGGSAGHLELIDLSVEPRNDFVFNGVGHGKAFNLGLRQMLVGVDEAAIAMPADLILVPASLDYAGYLATFTYRVSDDASGSFLVDLLAVPLDSDAVSENRTFVFGSPLEAATADVAPIDDVAVSGVAPALVTVEPGPAPSSLPDGKKEPTTERRRSRKPR